MKTRFQRRNRCHFNMLMAIEHLRNEHLRTAAFYAAKRCLCFKVLFSRTLSILEREVTTMSIKEVYTPYNNHIRRF